MTADAAQRFASAVVESHSFTNSRPIYTSQAFGPRSGAGKCNSAGTSPLWGMVNPKKFSRYFTSIRDRSPYAHRRIQCWKKRLDHGNRISET